MFVNVDPSCGRCFSSDSTFVASMRMRNELLTAFVVSLFASAISYPIYQFILNDSKTGMVLEFSRLSDPAQYDAVRNSTIPVTVVMLTANPDQDFRILRDAEAALSTPANFVYDRRERSKLNTPQVHVIVHNTNSKTMPGSAKFMTPLRKMNASTIIDFIETSIALERQIISPNIEKVLCVTDQRIVLMNSVFGAYKAFTLYISNGYRSADSPLQTIDSNSSRSSVADLKPSIARNVLNPVRCEFMFGASLFGLMDV